MEASGRIAIITARGGSKRIPRKNIRPFRGRPIIAWSIDAALASGLFTEVMVSTDNGEIAETAAALGAQVPFLRSARNADDHATTADALIEVLDAYALRGRHFEVGCCIYPTAPFTTSALLRAGLERMELVDADCVLPVTRFDFPIWRSVSMDPSGRVLPWFPEHMNARSQDLPPAFHDAGQWYWFRAEALRRERSFFGGRTAAIELLSTQVQDIDREEDWRIAELKHAALEQGADANDSREHERA